MKVPTLTGGGRALILIAGLIAASASANAQPIGGQTDQLPTDPTASGGSTTKIPVTVPAGTEVLAAESSAVSAGAAPVSVEQPIDPDRYICGPGDTFELNFWGQQNFRLRLAANLEGQAFISKVGFVQVSGKTLTEVRKDVRKKVRANYPGLNFELTLVAPRSFLVHLADFVKTPGSYVAHPLERVSVVLARAGGAIGSRRRISLEHRNGKADTADLVLYEQTGDTKYNPFVLDGDVIRVPHADILVTIAGAVRRPGTYELVANKDLNELFSLAGGATSAAAHSLPIRIIRRNANQQQTFVESPWSGTTPSNTPLVDDDIVQVRGAEELQRTILLIGAVAGANAIDPATTSKRLPYIDGDTVLSLITRAGGIESPGDLRRAYISRYKNGAAQQIPIDLDALLVRRDFKADRPISLDDTIVVPPLQYSVLVEGAVARGGMYPYNPQFGIPEYIAHAGGRTRTARDLDEVKLIDWNGKTHDYNRNLRPAPGDSILVPERNFTRAEVVQIVIAGAGLIVSAAAITIAATR